MTLLLLLLLLSRFSHVRLWPQRWQHTRLPHPWNSPGKNTGMGCHSLLQRIFLTQRSNAHLPPFPALWQILYPLSHLGSPTWSPCLPLNNHTLGFWIGLASLVTSGLSVGFPKQRSDKEWMQDRKKHQAHCTARQRHGRLVASASVWITWHKALVAAE